MYSLVEGLDVQVKEGYIHLLVSVTHQKHWIDSSWKVVAAMVEGHQASLNRAHSLSLSRIPALYITY